MAATIGNLPNYIHKIHMGELLAKKNYDYADVLLQPRPLFPQDIRNCTQVPRRLERSVRTAKTRRGDNWKNAAQPRWPAAPAMTASTSRPARA